MKGSIFYQDIPFWPSLTHIQPEVLKTLTGLYKNFKKVNVLEGAGASARDDIWIFLPGSVQIQTLTWLQKNFKNGKGRPRALFFLNGEATKLAFLLYHFQMVFSPEDTWLVSCQAEKNLIDEWFPGQDRTRVHLYPVNFSLFKPSATSYRSQFSLPQGKELLLYAGRLSWQKNIQYLLPFVSKHKDLHLVLSGDFDILGVPHLDGIKTPHLPSLIFDKIKSLNLGSRVSFIPYLSQPDLARLMQSCDYQISVSAHYGEDFGYSIAQGLACGLKTFLTSWGGHHTWNHAELNLGVSYTGVDWRGKSVGRPQVQSFNWPTQSPKGFFELYQKMSKAKLKVIVDEALSRPRGKGVMPRPLIHHDLTHYWEELSKNPRPALFSTPKDRLFKTVVQAYSAPKFN